MIDDVETNPYQAPKEVTDAGQATSRRRPTFWAFIVACVLVGVANVAILPTLNSKSGSGFLPLCIVNAPAMPALVAVMAIVSIFIAPADWGFFVESVFIAVLAILGPVMWGLIAAYFTWRWNSRRAAGEK
jgi:ABC-type Fe3+ transport system permease subunit